MLVQLKSQWKGQAAGTRVDVAKDDAELLMKAGVAEALPDGAAGELVAETMSKAIAKMTEQLNTVIDTALKEFAAAQAKSRKNGVPAIFGDAGGDPKFCFGDWLLAVRNHDEKRLTEIYKTEKAALNTQTGTEGGFLVPTSFEPNVMRAAAENAIARPRATVIPVSGRSIQVPTLDHTTAPAAGDTSFFGGVVMRWTEEAASVTETEPRFKQLELVPHELSGYSLVSNTLLADSPQGLEALLTEIFGGAIAWYEDFNFIRGDGVGKPLGAVLTSAAWTKAITRNTANQVKLTDCATMIAALLPGWTPERCTFLCSPTALAQIIQISDTAGNIIWIPNAREKFPMSLFGIPLMVTEKLPALGTARDVCLIDWKQYLVADKPGIVIAYSEHFKFQNNQSAWRVVKRVDGQPWVRSTITLSDATSTVSPFVYLA